MPNANSINQFKDLMQLVQQDANQDGDVEVVLRLDEFNIFQGSHSDEVKYTEYLVPDLDIFMDRFDDVIDDHNSKVDAFWDVMNEHYQQ